MTPGRRGGLTRPHLSPGFCATDAPLSAYLAPPDCLAAGGVVDRPADGSADMKPAARARMPAPCRAAYSRRSRRATPSRSCRTPGTPERHRRAKQRSARPGNSPPRLSCPRALARGASGPAEAHPVVAQREIAGELALLAPRQDLVKIVGLAQGAVQIFRVRRCPAETLIVVFDKSRQPCIGRFYRRNARQPQFLDQPILQRAERALDTALGLRAVGTENIDVQLRQGAAELGRAVAARSVLGIHPRDAVLVAVERDRLAMPLKIAARRAEIVECRFRRDKPQMHQSACRVVNKRQQRAFLCAVLKPGVFRSVDLH